METLLLRILSQATKSAQPATDSCETASPSLRDPVPLISRHSLDFVSKVLVAIPADDIVLPSFYLQLLLDGDLGRSGKYSNVDALSKAGSLAGSFDASADRRTFCRRL